jgi:amino-acid N-acetyltransferase
VPVIVDRVRPEDEPAIVRLITDSGLPTAGLLDHLESAVVARLDGRIVACAALEIYADGALLRSVAVEESLRGSGLGQQVVRAALDLARQRGTTSVFLLTTTAETFFPRFGFRRVARADVPPGVRASVEFRSACPASAVAMVVHMGGGWERRS